MSSNSDPEFMVFLVHEMPVNLTMVTLFETGGKGQGITFKRMT